MAAGPNSLFRFRGSSGVVSDEIMIWLFGVIVVACVGMVYGMAPLLARRRLDRTTRNGSFLVDAPIGPILAHIGLPLRARISEVVFVDSGEFALTVWWREFENTRHKFTIVVCVSGLDVSLEAQFDGGGLRKGAGLSVGRAGLEQVGSGTVYVTGGVIIFCDEKAGSFRVALDRLAVIRQHLSGPAHSEKDALSPCLPELLVGATLADVELAHGRKVEALSTVALRTFFGVPPLWMLSLSSFLCLVLIGIALL
jgi:hypothetical protein